MEITLKKARKLEKALRDCLSKVELAGATRMSIYGQHGTADVESLAKERTGFYEENLQAYVKGTAVVRDLRRSIGKANNDTGVDAILAEHGVLVATIAKLGALPSTPPVVADEVSGKLIANAKTDVTYGSDSETLHFAAPGVGAALSAARRRKLVLEDDLARINQVTTLDVGDDLRRVLERYDLL